MRQIYCKNPFLFNFTVTSLPAYAELHCISNFTFLRGASHAQELVVRAQALGYSALAITDECSLAGVVRAQLEAKQHGLQLIIATEVQIEDGPKLVLFATNRESYGHISTLSTRAPAAGKRVVSVDLRRSGTESGSQSGAHAPELCQRYQRRHGQSVHRYGE